MGFITPRLRTITNGPIVLSIGIVMCALSSIADAQPRGSIPGQPPKLVWPQEPLSATEDSVSFGMADEKHFQQDVDKLVNALNDPHAQVRVDTARDLELAIGKDTVRIIPQLVEIIRTQRGRTDLYIFSLIQKFGPLAVDHFDELFGMLATANEEKPSLVNVLLKISRDRNTDDLTNRSTSVIKYGLRDDSIRWSMLELIKGALARDRSLPANFPELIATIEELQPLPDSHGESGLRREALTGLHQLLALTSAADDAWIRNPAA